MYVFLTHTQKEKKKAIITYYSHYFHMSKPSIIKKNIFKKSIVNLPS